MDLGEFTGDPEVKLEPVKVNGVIMMVIHRPTGDVVATGMCFDGCPAAGFPLSQYQKGVAWRRLADSFRESYIQSQLNPYIDEETIKYILRSIKNSPTLGDLAIHTITI